MDRLRFPLVVTGCALVLNAAFLLAALVLEQRYGLPASALYRDPNAVAGQSFIIGWFSQMAGAAWIAAAAVAFFTCALARRRDGVCLSLACFGAFTGLAGVDDLLMLHDGLLPRLGVSAMLLYLTYILLLGFGLAHWRRSAVRADWPLPVLAVGGLGASFVIDFFDDRGMFGGGHVFLVEDLFKSFGLTIWVIYILASSWRTATGAIPAVERVTHRTARASARVEGLPGE